MEFLIENLPIISLDLGVRDPSACTDMTCSSFNNACRVHCGTITCGSFTCSAFA